MDVDMDKTLQRIMREICTEGEETDLTNSKWGVMKTENCEVSRPARQTNVHKSKYLVPVTEKQGSKCNLA